MGFWNYRILHRADGPNRWYELVEMYYDDQGNPNGWGSADAPHGTALETIHHILKDMAAAVDRPVLDELTLFPKKKKKKKKSTEKQALKKLKEDLK